MANKKQRDVKVLVEMVLELSKGNKEIDVKEFVRIMKKYDLDLGENGELIEKKK